MCEIAHFLSTSTHGCDMTSSESKMNDLGALYRSPRHANGWHGLYQYTMLCIRRCENDTPNQHLLYNYETEDQTRMAAIPYPNPTRFFVKTARHRIHPIFLLFVYLSVHTQHATALKQFQ